MADHSFESIRIQDITAAAGVNHATFYRHYPDKFRLVDDLFAEALDSMILALGPRKTLPELEATDSTEIVKSWGVIFKHVADNARLYRTLFGSSGNAAFLRRIREHFASVVKERMEPRLEAGTPSAPRGMTKKPASDLPYALAANVMIGTIVWWLEEGQDYDLDEVILLTREIMHDGFRRLLRV
jgi:AcrR family transcriptional regulator